MNFTTLPKADWIEMEERITRICRPLFKRVAAKMMRRLRKKWKRYQHQKRKQ